LRRGQQQGGMGEFEILDTEEPLSKRMARHALRQNEA
jgi:hypothetical protein